MKATKYAKLPDIEQLDNHDKNRLLSILKDYRFKRCQYYLKCEKSGENVEKLRQMDLRQINRIIKKLNLDVRDPNELERYIQEKGA